MTGDFYRNVRALKQVRSLAARGHTVTVVSLAGNAPPLALPPGVRVRTMPFPAGSGPRWFLDVHKGMQDMLRALSPRHVHASDLYVLPACARRARQNNVRLTYDARELYPHVASTIGKPWATWFWRALEGHYVCQPQTVFTVSGRIADHMAQTYGIARPRVIYNAPDLPPSQPDQAPSEPGTIGDIRLATGLDGDTPLVVHVGQIRKGRGVDTLVRALPYMPGVHIALLGYGPERDGMLGLAMDAGTRDRLHMLDPISPWDVPSYIRTASVGVTLLDNSCLNHRYALPNKLFDYFSAGLPVVASDLPEIRDVLTRFGAGVTTLPGAEALGRAIVGVTNDPDRLRNGSQAACSEMNWLAVETEFCSAFNEDSHDTTSAHTDRKRPLGVDA